MPFFSSTVFLIAIMVKVWDVSMIFIDNFRAISSRVNGSADNKERIFCSKPTLDPSLEEGREVR